MEIFMTKRNLTQDRPLLALMTLVIGNAWLAGCGSPIPAIIPGPLPAAPSLPTASPSSVPAPNIRFGRIDVSRGLSQSVVNCILQDAQGFIWVGTQDGLNRYDGYTFKIFRPASNDPQTINDRWINSLFQDKKGYIWIGTRQGGLNRYDPVTGLFSHFINDPVKPSSLISDQVQAVFVDSQERFWVGTSGGLDRFVSATAGFEHFKLNTLPASESNGLKPQPFSEGSIDNITSIFEDKQGYLWVASASEGLNRYDEKNNIFINYSRLAANPTTAEQQQHPCNPGR